MLSGCTRCSCRKLVDESLEMEATCCHLYRNAVWDYVEQWSDRQLQRTMLARLEHFVAQVDDCEDIECFIVALEKEKISKTFSALFLRALDESSQIAGGGSAVSIEAIRCGLEHGISDWKDTLLTRSEHD